MEEKCSELNDVLSSSPKYVHVLISRTCECFLMWHKGNCRYDQFRLLRWGDYSGLSVQVQCIHGDLSGGILQESESGRGCDSGSMMLVCYEEGTVMHGTK